MLQFCRKSMVKLPSTIGKRYVVLFHQILGWYANRSWEVANQSTADTVVATVLSCTKASFKAMSSYHDMEMTWVWLMFTTGWWYTYPSEKYESNGMIIPSIWKNKNCSNHNSMTRLASEIPVTKRMGQLPQSPPSFNCFPRGCSGRNPTCFDFGTMMFNIVQLISEPVGFLMIFGFPETSDQSLLLVGAAFLNDLNFTEKKSWGKLHLPSGGQTRQWDIVLKLAFKWENRIWGFPKMEAPKMDRL